MSPNKENFDEIRYHILERLNDLKALEKQVNDLEIKMAVIQGKAIATAFILSTILPFLINLYMSGE